MSKESKIKRKSVWVAWTNSDLTEGKGFSKPYAVCELRATAVRLGRGKGVQGADCLVTQEFALMAEEYPCWLVPGSIKSPNRADILEQEKYDKYVRAKNKAIECGLSLNDLEAIQNGSKLDP